MLADTTKRPWFPGPLCCESLLLVFAAIQAKTSQRDAIDSAVDRAFGFLVVLPVALQVLHMQERRQVRLFLRADVYGRVTQDELPLDEHQALRPVSPYAASKVAADALALADKIGEASEARRAREGLEELEMVAG